jgi:predicted hydrocarbon binding protein
MTDPCVKGSAIIPGFNYIEKHYGKEGLDKIIARMGPEDGEPLKKKLLAGKWYPFKSFIGLLRASDDVFGKGNNSFIMELASLSAKEGLSTFYKFFVKIGNPKATIKRTKKIWQSYFNFGQFDVVKIEDNNAVFRISGMPEPRREFCMAMAGWTKGAMELASGANAEVKENRCCCLGDDFCEFEVRWE